MSVIVDILDDELFDNLTETGERADGAGLALREAIGLINAGSSTGPILFDASLAGGVLNLNTGNISLQQNLTFMGDISGSGASDVTIQALTGDSLFIFDIAGVSLTNTLTNIIHDATGTGVFRSTLFDIDANSISISNDATILHSGDVTNFGDLSIAIDVAGDDFTFTNIAGGSFISEGRSVIQANVFTGNGPITLNTTIINHGLMEAQDDTIRIPEGEITNSGIIRSTGEFSSGGTAGTAGLYSDAMSLFGDYDSANYSTGRIYITVNNLDGGLIEGARSGVFLSVSGVVNNDGTIRGESIGVFSQDASFSDGSPMPYTFALNNTGTIISEGQNYGLNDNQSYAGVTIYGGTIGDAGVITNSGTILSPDVGVHAFTGVELYNLATGIVNGNSNGVNSGAISFIGSALERFELGTTTISRTLVEDTNFVSTQNVTVDANGFILIDGVAYDQYLQVPLLRIPNSDAPYVLALIDIAATQAAGSVVFQTNVADPVFPASIDLAWSGGTLTVTTNNGVSVVTDQATGLPIYNPPATTGYGDIIENAGTMIGDIFTGLGDDDVLNSGIIDGEIDLGRGDDVFTRLVSGSNEAVSGGEGNDILTGSDGEDIFNGDAGDDTLIGGAGADRLNGGAGIDTADYSGSAGGVSVFAGGRAGRNNDAQGDRLDSIEEFIGSDFADQFTLDSSTQDINFVDAGGGNDRIRNRDGSDGDVLNGEGGNDNIFGGAGSETLNGGDGMDTLQGNGGDDILDGGNDSSRDILIGGAGDDILTGGGGNDALRGNSGDDTIFGGDDRDNIDGGNGADTLFGEAGNDVLDGGNGSNDILDGGTGNDLLTGGIGNDIFVFAAGYEIDRITDFNNGAGDIVDASDFGVADFTALQALMFNTANDVRIDFGDGDVLIFQGLTMADLDASDFIF